MNSTPKPNRLKRKCSDEYSCRGRRGQYPQDVVGLSETEGHRVIGVSNFQDALAEASRRSFEIAFVDLRLGTADGLDLIPALLISMPWLKIIVITAYASVDTAVEAMRRGATDYIPKPFTPTQIKLAVRKVDEMRTLEQKVARLPGGSPAISPGDRLLQQQSCDAAGRESRPAGGVQRCHRPSSGRKRNRQNRSCPGDSLLQSSGLASLSESFPARLSLRSCSKASSLAMSKVPLQGLFVTTRAA